MSRSDIIPIDSRSHLEVADKKHRYAKNLRTYFKEYHRINGLSDIVERSVPNYGNSTPSRKWARYDPFFDWLDVQEPLPNLAECPRAVLDEDKVEYLTTETEREVYEISIVSSRDNITTGDAMWYMTQTGEPVSTGPKGWIFVLLNGRMYACEKRTSTFPRFHHSSFFAGAGVSAAGMLVCVNGKLTKLFPHSGHYRPHDRHLYSLLAFLRDKSVDLGAVQVDVQRVMKLSRQQDKDGAKAKKTESAFYLDGDTAYNFLKSKTGFQESGVLRQINKRRLEYLEGEVTPSVRARANSNPNHSSNLTQTVDVAVAASVPVQAMRIDTLGDLPSLHKADSGDSVSPSQRDADRQRGKLSLAAPSNRSSLNRLSLNSTGASTIGSGSPFCSPVAQYQYPLRSSSGSAGDALADAAYAGSSSVFASKGSSGKESPGGDFGSSNSNNPSSYSARGGLFCGSNSGDDALMGTYDTGEGFEATFGGEYLSRSGGRSSADARALVLSNLLFADPAAAHNPNNTQAHVGKSRGTLPSSPPIPHSGRSSGVSVNNNSSGSIGSLFVHTGIAASTPVAKIPVAVPIKKVTSYTSISSSYGSSSYLQQHFGGSSRSRSASKTEELEHDLRVLLGDSPVVHAPIDFNYYNYEAGGGNSPINGSTSACNSRGRSRVSSFNPPYLPTSSATFANNNIAIASTTGGSEAPLLYNLSVGAPSGHSRAGSAHSTPIASVRGGITRAGGSRGPTPITSVHHSPADKSTPPSFLSISSKALSASPSLLVDRASVGQRLNAFTPRPAHPDAVEVSQIPTEDITIQEAAECPPSPVPSFASSLSSTDSLPNMMLDYMRSPGGTHTVLHFDGLYEEAQGDDYNDYIYGSQDQG